VFVRIYWVLLKAGFRRQSVYRLALVSGLVTNAFFGVIRTTVFTALYRNRPEVAGLVRADILTYTCRWAGVHAIPAARPTHASRTIPATKRPSRRIST
jgi:ABC-type uncharacterized transport system permease subunit